MKNTDRFEKLLNLVFVEDKANNPMPYMKAAKLLKNIKNTIEKYAKEN